MRGASAALFPAFGNRRSRHRARFEGQVGGTKEHSVYYVRLPLRQGVLFIGARNELPSSIGIRGVLEKGGLHISTVPGLGRQRCSLLHITPVQDDTAKGRPTFRVSATTMPVSSGRCIAAVK